MMHAPRQSPSPRARESCSKPVMTHPRTSRRVSRRFTTGKTSRPQWATSLLGWHGPRTAGGRTGASRDRVVQECRGRTGRRNVTAQECHAQGGMGRTDRRESCSWEPLHLTARGSRALTSGRVMEATGPPSSAGLPGLLSPSDQLNSWQSRAPPTLSPAGPTELPGIPNPAGLTGPLGVLSRPESPRQPRAARKAEIRVCPGSRDVGTIRGDEYSSPSGRDDRPASRSPSGVVHAPGRAFPARVPRSS